MAAGRPAVLLCGETPQNSFMSTNILKKLVEQFAPETVRKEIAEIDKVAAVEREARNERAARERGLLTRLERLAGKAGSEPVLSPS